MTKSLGDRLDAIHVRARVPGTEIEAELRQRRQLTLSFGESVYEWLSEPALERTLASLARLLHTGWVRQYRTALEGTAINIDQDAGFVAEREKIEAVGSSADGRVTISANGMTDFRVRIVRGTIRELSERQFAAAAQQAATAFLDDQSAKINTLRLAYFS